MNFLFLLEALFLRGRALFSYYFLFGTLKRGHFAINNLDHSYVKYNWHPRKPGKVKVLK